MKRHSNFKLLILLAYFFVLNFSVLAANESISLKWEASFSPYGKKMLLIVATQGKQFTVNWGDGSPIDTVVAWGNLQLIAHAYSNTNTDYFTVTITGVTSDCLFYQLHCDYSKLTSLDVSNAKSLRVLWCNDNQITILDVSKNTNLQTLGCYNNQLTSLNVDHCTALIGLDCRNNQLTSLKLDNHPALSGLDCSNNQITNLDVSSAIDLQSLLCQYNQLTSLNVGNMGNGALWSSIDCYNNRLTSLDVSNTNRLSSLSCYNNQLTSLNVSNSSLSSLQCANNQLESLDVSSCTRLTSFGCSYNNLTNLDVSNCKLLMYFSCNDNHLTLSNLYTISKSVTVSIYNLCLGPQTLALPEIELGASVDFSEQKVFDGISTVYTIKKNGLPASQNDYTLVDGIITFYNGGNYTIAMTNAAIESHPGWPAKVLAEIKVGNVNIAEPKEEVFKIRAYPNPTPNKFVVEYEGVASIILYDMLGKEVLRQNINGNTEIALNQATKGVYCMNVISEGKMIGSRKIVKQ